MPGAENVKGKPELEESEAPESPGEAIQSLENGINTTLGVAIRPARRRDKSKISLHQKCPLNNGVDETLVPWPGLKYASIGVLELYCKIFNQQELFKMIVRKICSSCTCYNGRRNHVAWFRGRDRVDAGVSLSTDIPYLLSAPVAPGFTWTPPNLLPSEAEEFFQNFPPDKIPRRGTPGESYRDQKFQYQVPKQDMALAYCKHVSSQHHATYQDFVSSRNEHAMEVAFVCRVDLVTTCLTCGGQLPEEALAVFAVELGMDAAFHPHCFQCVVCKDPFVDLAHCHRSRNLLCLRHYGEQIYPRCAGCDELIFANHVKALDKSWHVQHFRCNQCELPLEGKKFLMHRDHPHCFSCFEITAASSCARCKEIIDAESKTHSYANKNWHETCFVCSQCEESSDSIWCTKCYDPKFQCSGCEDGFAPGTKIVENGTRRWHEACLVCDVCKHPIGDQTFVPHDDEIYCSGCFEVKFVTRCIRCSRIITGDSISYKYGLWHRDCFTCTSCQVPLADLRFTSKEDKPYCANCHAQLFAKRCTACDNPIIISASPANLGVGGTRFVSFEGRHWHNDCFRCCNCEMSLVGKGFISEGEEMICLECTKQSLGLEAIQKKEQ